jgi:hypothetical protein
MLQTICRLIQLSPHDAANLAANAASLPDRVSSASIYSDVYRYWHAIEYLLAQHRPESAAAKWLQQGAAIALARRDVPSPRVLTPVQVQEIHADLRTIQPEDLIPHYDAAALDAARIYPNTWQAWEEEFDPLGQVLEHYSFLQQFATQCATANAALLLYFDLLAEGTV